MSDTMFGPAESTFPAHDENDDNLDDLDRDAETSDDTDKNESTSKGSTSRGISRAQIRRIAAKAEDIIDADSRIVDIAAHLVGAPSTGVADLTTAIMSASRSASQPISDLNAIAEADPMEAGILATALGRPRLKAVWALLAALNAGPKGNMPTADTKAALAAAKAVFALDDIAKAELETVAALLKKN